MRARAVRTSPPFDRLNSSRPQANSPENGSRLRAISRQIGCVTEENHVSKLPRAPSRSAMWTSTRLVGIRDRQRAEAHGVDDFEQRGVGADSEREREDRDEREAGVSAEASQRIPDVLHAFLEPAPAPHVAGRFADLCHVAQLAAGRGGRGLRRLATRDAVGGGHR